LAEGQRKNLLTVKGEVLDSPVYSPTGHILFHRETTAPGLWAVPFSLARLETTGPPFLVVSEGSYPAISTGGTLIYADNNANRLSTLAWLDLKTGEVTAAFNERLTSMSQPKLSPDGRLAVLVVHIPGQGSTVIVVDLQRHTVVHLSDRADNFTRPAWRDARTVVYARGEGGQNRQIVMRPADGSAAETVLTTGIYPFVGKGMLLFSRIATATGGDLFQLPLGPGAAGAAAQLVQQTPAHELQPALSPDGSLLAYARGNGGETDIMVRTYPDQTGQWQVSVNGGTNPVWSPNGDGLYYRDFTGTIARVAIRKTPAVTLGTPQPVQRPADLLARVGFDISADGRRLLMVREARPDEQRAASLAVVQNWFAEFDRARSAASR
jgi:dipeptidyl aminopeptidase/acylaminoacyl peptidase